MNEIKIRQTIKSLPLMALLGLMGTLPTSAEINMKNASFISEWRDLKIHITEGDKDFQFEFRRIYNSRSAHLGFFGFGWCSPFEKNLKIVSDVALVNDCTLERAHQVKAPTKSNGVYHVQLNGETLIFDDRGRLAQIRSPHNYNIDLGYSRKGLLTKVSIQNRYYVQLIYGDSKSTEKKIVELKSSDGQRVKYQYEGDDLVAVKKKADKVRFSYDRHHNLTLIRQPSDAFEVITYDSTLDRVKKYRSVDRCIHRLTYRPSSNNTFLSAAEKSCNGTVVGRATYRFQIDEPRLIDRKVTHMEAQ